MIKRQAMIKSRAIVAAGIALLAASAPVHADVKAGVDAWSRGEYKKAVENWRPMAIAGDADAQFNLGQAYKLGRGVPVDLGLAEEWYRKAALQGHLQAEHAYGLTLFQNGKRDEAVRWLERSSARGEPRAQLVLGTMLFNGDAVKKDWVRAYALVSRSAAAGLPQGGQTLGQMDQYIPTDTRQQGIALARQYESAADRPTYQPELAGQGSSGMRGTELPASSYAEGGSVRPNLSTPTKPSRTPPVRTASPNLTSSPIPASTTRPMAGKGWRVQFGAFRDEGNARGLWQQITQKIGGMSSINPIYARAGTLTKLQAGPFVSRDDAAQLCRSVSTKMPGTPCVPIAP